LHYVGLCVILPSQIGFCFGVSYARQRLGFGKGLMVGERPAGKKL
jgi:hypothetical protein